jgi:hypothetical protein
MGKFNIAIVIFPDFQKLEREARICRKLQHPNIGERKLLHFSLFSLFALFNGKETIRFYLTTLNDTGQT